MEDLIRRRDAIEVMARWRVRSSLHLGIDDLPEWRKLFEHELRDAPSVEPNLLIAPETIERGSELYIGEDIVVVHQEDYMDMMCEAMMWGEYGGEPKIDIVRCKECKHYKPYLMQFTYEPRGDGYCGKERITSEGTAFINCEDEYFCPYGERLEE